MPTIVTSFMNHAMRVVSNWISAIYRAVETTRSSVIKLLLVNIQIKNIYDVTSAPAIISCHNVGSRTHLHKITLVCAGGSLHKMFNFKTTFLDKANDLVIWCMISQAEGRGLKSGLALWCCRSALGPRANYSPSPVVARWCLWLAVECV